MIKLLNDAIPSWDQDQDCGADLIGDPLSVLKSTVEKMTKSVK